MKKFNRKKNNKRDTTRKQTEGKTPAQAIQNRRVLAQYEGS